MSFNEPVEGMGAEEGTLVYMCWEPDEDERLATEFRQGKTVSEMADLHGRGESAILSRLIKLDLISRGGPSSQSR